MEMTPYEIYVFFLCLVVFVLLVGFSSICISTIYRLCVRLIRSGHEDERLITEDEKARRKKDGKFVKILYSSASCLLLAFLAVVFFSSMYVNCTQSTYFENIPTYRVVNTGSMAKVHANNSYLDDLGIDDRIQTFDLITTYKIPKEEDLELYDIVVYEVDETLIVHRIVGIESPNEQHPNEYHYLLQGDAVDRPDRYPVLYSQMKGIYYGERIPFIGSFVLFMQSPAGWLCMLFALGTTIVSPIMEKKLYNEKQKRLRLICGEVK